MDDHFHLFDYNNHSNNNSKINACSSSSSLHDNNNQPPSSSSDEISLFLHQILYRSSSSSSTTSSSLVGPLTQSLSLPPENSNSHPLLCKSLGISAGDSGAFLSENEKVTAAAGGGNVSSSALGVSENEMTDDYDCESEEGIEALVDENPAKPAPSRNSSKRARAAEVHNLSEKRRRSRINEKMKALQNLIPNSYKTDKASMLDEAIEYLKQLQLQVQMLTMRNGSTLHPMCLPGVLQPIQFSQMRMGFGEQNGSLQMNTVGALTANQETPGQTVFSLSNQCTSSNQLQIPNMANIINSETSFGLDSSIHAHFGSFQLHASSEETCRVDTLPHQQLNVNHSETIPSATVLLPFDTHALGLKDGSLQACMMGRNQAEGVPIKNFECNRILSPPYTCMRMGRSVPDDDSKLERKDF